MEIQKPQLPNFKHNVYKESGKDTIKVAGRIDRKVYDYFFLHLIPYEHGSVQAIINFFFECLYVECQNQRIPPVWDEDSGPKLNEILNRLNFNDNRQTASECSGHIVIDEYQPRHTLD